MPKFIYIRAEVAPPDAGRVSFLNSLVEKVTDTPQPDVVPHTDPGAISFSHTQLEATDIDDAYLKGWEHLPPPKPGTVCNDYVVPVTTSTSTSTST